MDEHELETIGKRLLPKKYFLGVFSLDSLPQRLKGHQMCIVHRTQPNGVGHWFSIFKQSKRIIELFDSLIAPQDVRDTISQHFDCHVYSNNQRYQMPGTDTCGIFSLYFLFHRFLNLGILTETCNTCKLYNESLYLHCRFVLGRLHVRIL